MLLEFSCSNYRSIMDKATFSFIASSERTDTDNFIDFENLKVLRTAVIYGANASGKTNVLSAIENVQNLVGSSNNYQPGDVFNQYNNKYLGEHKPSEYQLHFVKDGTRFCYGFSVLDSEFTSEYLYYFPDGIQCCIFERSKSDTNGLKINVKHELEDRLIRSIEATKANQLFLSRAANLSNVEEIITAFKFITKDLFIKQDSCFKWVLDWTGPVLMELSRNERLKSYVIKELRSYDIFMKDIIITKSSNDSTKATGSNKDSSSKSSVDGMADYGDYKLNLLGEESRGTLLLIIFISILKDIIDHDKTIIYDELDASLHEKVLLDLLDSFSKRKDNKAQLLFTCHTTYLLHEQLFRRDQVWFTERKDNGGTKLYSLVARPDMEPGEDIQQGYLEGKYGAIPDIKDHNNT